jgi:hypothetical protein
MTADQTDRARDLVRRARQIRTAAGVSLPAMARHADVGKSTLSVWERTPPDVLAADPAGYWAAKPWLAALEVLDRTNGGQPALTGRARRAAPRRAGSRSTRRTRARPARGWPSPHAGTAAGRAAGR